MIKFLVRKTIADYEATDNKDVRQKYGILGGTLGIICNLFLFCIKLAIGTVMNSIAITSDAFNNLSDTGSSIVSVISARLSNRHPDKEHPFGHGRIEYVSSLIVSFIIMLVGIELLRNSFDKIIHPQEVVFNLVLVIILAVSMLVKVWMFFYNRFLGRAINSGILIATATDSLNDVIATAAIILSTILGQFLSFPIDGIAGLIVSLIIIYTGFGIAKDTVGILLGTPPGRELVEALTAEVLTGDGIVGVHDLIVHDYGVGRVMASVHAEVPDDINIVTIHEVIDATEQRVLEEMGINIVIHMDPISINSPQTEAAKKQIHAVIERVNSGFSFHDFRMVQGENQINLIFDMAVPCEMSAKSRALAIEEIKKGAKAIDPRYNLVIKLDDAFY